MRPAGNHRSRIRVRALPTPSVCALRSTHSLIFVAFPSACAGILDDSPPNLVTAGRRNAPMAMMDLPFHTRHSRQTNNRQVWMVWARSLAQKWCSHCLVSPYPVRVRSA